MRPLLAPSLALFALALGACAPAAVEPPRVAIAAAAAAPAPPPDPRWRRVVSPALGLSFDLPGEPSEWRMPPDGASWVSTDLSLGAPDRDEVAYHLFRTDLDIHDRATDAVVLRTFVKGHKDLIKDEPFTLGGYRGVRITQSTASGRVRETRVIVIGRSFVSVEVQASAEKLSGEDVTRFFGSLQLALPWEVRGFADLRCTMAIPTAAMELARPKRDALPDEVKLRTFHLGGDGEVTLAVAENHVDRVRLAHLTEDQMLDRVVKAATTSDRTLLKQEPITHDGRRGREATYRLTGEKGALIRVRMLLIGDRLYQLVVEGRTEDQLDDAVARRFYQSFRADPGE